MSTTPNVRLLAIGDVHLGTRPGSLPTDLANFGIEVSELTPESALAITIEKAIELRVHAVLFAGDVVESTNARFEALRPLEIAIARLHEEGIPALAVVGNHDVEALPLLVERVEGLEIIGAGGVWESRTISAAGEPVAEILGWSFPERQVRTSPVAALLREPLAASGLPRIGLIHGDLDASGGVYAPFTSRELSEAGLDAWLLGHIHKPSLGASAEGDTPCGYLGSLLGLSPKESGPHGPWLIELDGTGAIEHEQLVLSPLRWEHVDVQVGEEDGPEEVAELLLDEAERIAGEYREVGCAPRALGLRVQLVGRSTRIEALEKQCEGGAWEDLRRETGDTLVFINRVRCKLELAHDLEQLARGEDPPALLAKKLLTLQAGGAECAQLVAKARLQLQPVAASSHWLPLENLRDSEDPLSDEGLRATLVRAGTSALGALLSQREGRTSR
jgi:DNA repair protein SbcD/Mre11